MKTILTSILLFYLALLPSLGQASLFECKLKRADLTAVVTPEKRIEPVEQFETLLGEAIQQIRQDDGIDNFILFVHGMGPHPCHAFEKSLIADMQVDYSARVIMYHWPSWEGPIAFPEENARRSAKDFKNILLCIKAYRERQSDLLENIKFTLITHSMGSLVLEALMRNENGQSIPMLFDTLVINASASPGKKHAAWVEKIRLSEHIYITVNQQDTTLGKAELHEEWDHGGSGWGRLGKRLANKNGVDVVLARNAQYVDLTAFNFRHVYYLHRYLSKSPAAKYFFDAVLNGAPAVFNQNRGLKGIKRERIYILGK